VRWLRQALRDLDEIAIYIARDDQRTAQDVAGRIWETASTLRLSPERGRVGRVPGTRELVLPNLPYFLAYRVRDGEVQVMRVIHQRLRS
jgi:addiction module RelE/StbE family toxin